MNTLQAKKLGNHLKSARQALGISARELARRINIPNSTVVRIEQGAFAEPSPLKLQKIAMELKLNAADLYLMANYPLAKELPSLAPYLRTKFPELTEQKVKAIVTYSERLI